MHWLFLKFRKIPDNQILRSKLEEIIVSTPVKEVISVRSNDCTILVTFVIYHKPMQQLIYSEFLAIPDKSKSKDFLSQCIYFLQYSLTPAWH